MKTAWTPGPWFVEVGMDEDDDGVVYICHPETISPDSTVCSFGRYSNAGDRANGHLIAAAPEMYALLESIKDELLYKLSFDETSGMGEIAEGFGQAIFSVLQKARGE